MTDDQNSENSKPNDIGNKALEIDNSLKDIASFLKVLANNELTKAQAKPIALSRGVSIFENHWFTRALLAGGGIIAIIAITLSSISFLNESKIWRAENQARAEEASFRRKSEISNAWSALLNRAGGNTGKANALETLLFNSGSIKGVDLSCRNIGYYEGQQCLNPPLFEFHNARYFKGDPKSILTDDPTTHTWENGYGWTISDVDLSGITMENFTLQGATLKDTNFDKVVAVNLNFDNVAFDYDDTSKIGRFVCTNCNVSGEFGNRLPWQFVAGFRESNIFNSIVVFPHDTILERTASDVSLKSLTRELTISLVGKNGKNPYLSYWLTPDYFQDVAKNLPLFLKSDVVQPAPYGELLASPASDNVFWELYEALFSCANLKDGRRVNSIHSSCVVGQENKDLREEIMVRLRDQYNGSAVFYAQNQMGEAYLVSFDCDKKFDLNDANSPAPPENCFFGDGWGY
ncbi:MAG: hypothetical protein ABJO86_14325 [Lentilitoribacter sp.]